MLRPAACSTFDSSSSGSLAHSSSSASRRRCARAGSILAGNLFGGRSSPCVNAPPSARAGDGLHAVLAVWWCASQGRRRCAQSKAKRAYDMACAAVARATLSVHHLPTHPVQSPCPRSTAPPTQRCFHLAARLGRGRGSLQPRRSVPAPHPSSRGLLQVTVRTHRCYRWAGICEGHSLSGYPRGWIFRSPVAGRWYGNAHQTPLYLPVTVHARLSPKP